MGGGFARVNVIHLGVSPAPVSRMREIVGYVMTKINAFCFGQPMDDPAFTLVATLLCVLSFEDAR